MKQSHHFSCKLTTRYKEPSTAYWSVGSPRTLALFVHGFGGGADSTWPLFPSLLPLAPGAVDFDFVFYRYDGVSTQANSSAMEFFTFLDHFLREPLPAIRRSLGANRRPRGFRYQRVLFVGHSLGSVVVRRALLIGRKAAAKDLKTRAWLSTARMVLIAPAHRGAYAAALASELLTDLPWFLGRLLGYLGKYRSPLIEELKPGSVVLDDLSRETVQALVEEPGAGHLVARRVFWARNDRVVINAEFGADPLPIQLDDRDHFTICKPRHLDDPVLMAVANEVKAP